MIKRIEIKIERGLKLGEQIDMRRLEVDFTESSDLQDIIICLLQHIKNNENEKKNLTIHRLKKASEQIDSLYLKQIEKSQLIV